MKKIFSLLALLILCVITQAQEKPVIKQGSRLLYSVTVKGNSFPMYFELDAFDNSNCSIIWNFEDGRSGKFIMERSSLDSASLCYWDRPVTGEELLLPPTHNVLFLSRFIFSALRRDKTAMFDEYVVRIKAPAPDNAFKVAGKVIDALYLDSESGTKIWVLNDPVTPLILKIEGNPFGVEAELMAIE